MASVAILARVAPVAEGGRYFLGLYTICFFFFLQSYRTFPHRLPIWMQWGIILGVSILSRLLLLPSPALDDVNRYIWDGYIFNRGFNPYLMNPDDARLLELGSELPDIWSGIKHRTATACYPPLATLLFSLAARIEPSLLFFKILVLSFDLATILVLGALLRVRGLPLRRLILYALNPLVLVFVAGEGHLDPIQGFFLVLALFFVAKDRSGWGFLSLGCAVVSKYFSLFTVPFVLNARNVKKVPLLLLVPALSYLPFWGTGLNLFSSLKDFVTYYTFNGPVQILLHTILGGSVWMFLVVLLGISLAVVFLLEHDSLRSAYLAIGCVLVFMPILNPWYLLWITPFLPLFASRAWLYLHLAIVPASHLASLGLVEQSTPWLLFEYLPFAGLLFWDAFFARGRLSELRFPPASTLSVVVPTFNEKKNLVRCLQALSRQSSVTEVIVADAGSTDGSIEEAERLGALVVRAAKGRGIQIRAGVDRARGDIVLVLHADCVLREGVAERIVTSLGQNPSAVGGALGMDYMEASFRKRALAWLNNAKARWPKISFGDQGQFFRRQALESVGGFPPLMLMEDVELSMRLRGIGDVIFLRQGILVSGRRWDQGNFGSAFLGTVWLVLLFLFQRRLGLMDPSGSSYYHRYYG